MLALLAPRIAIVHLVLQCLQTVLNITAMAKLPYITCMVLTKHCCYCTSCRMIAYTYIQSALHKYVKTVFVFSQIHIVVCSGKLVP
jgi:hypothetical protein